MSKVFYIICLFAFLNAYSQNQSNIWYFGDKAGVDFSSGAPVALTDGQMQIDEGCSTMADANGQLLFYTNGTQVWDSSHNVMPNGSGLMGHNSSTQSSVVVPKPGSSTIYYIFTTPDLGSENGARYSEVDMSLNNGLGDVTENKNILLITPSCEKIAAVKKADDTGYWLLLHGYNNSYLAYSVTEEGVNASPVITNIGFNAAGVNYTVGYMKFSPDGSKLVNCFYEQGVEFYDFDTATGIVSNLITINNYYANYGAEFSMSGNVLYITTGTEYIRDIYQYDLTATDIPATETLLYSASTIDHQTCALQLAIDGKIYVSVFDEPYLSVINNPEVLGAGCNLTINTVPLLTGVAKSGLPQFIQSFFDVSILSQNTCLGQETGFQLNGNQNIVSASWDFGDGYTSSEINPAHTYSTAGTYMVEVTATTATETIIETKEVTISGLPVAYPIVNQTVCGNVGALYSLQQNNTAILNGQDNTVFSVAYFLSSNDAELHTNIISTDYQLALGVNNFFAKIYNSNNRQCHAIISFSVTLYAVPTVNPINNYVICEALPYDNTEQFDLSIKLNEILGNQDPSVFAVSFHASENDATNDIAPLPLLYTNQDAEEVIYVRIENIGNQECFVTGMFSVVVIHQPEVNNIIGDFILCNPSGNTAVFDLTEKTPEILNGLPNADYTVKYYSSLQNAENYSNAIVSPFINEYNYQVIYARVEAVNNALCNTIISFKLINTTTPNIQTSVNFNVCDDALNDAQEMFDLTLTTLELLGNQDYTQFNISYFVNEADAQTATNQIPSSYTNISNPQTVYARVESIENPGCFSIASILLNIDAVPQLVQVFDLYSCSNNANTLTSIFSFQQQTTTILSAQPNENFVVKYFVSQQDAEQSINELDENYENATSPQTVYARIENSLNPVCTQIITFNLIVFEKPQLAVNEQYYLCNGAVTVEVPGVFDSYSWSTGESGNLILITEPGHYWVTVYNDYEILQCSEIKQFDVLEYDQADFSIETTQLTLNNNSINISGANLEAFEYSIDGISYQDSPNFTNLEAGNYVVYIRDKSRCNTITINVSIFNYPRYFTPNSDGVSDKWNIYYSDYKNEVSILIYDRYGKVIASINNFNEGWDGKLNGQPLPATDYWFVAKYGSAIFKGHFSLIR